MIGGVAQHRRPGIGGGRVCDHRCAGPIGIVVAPVDEFPDAQNLLTGAIAVDVKNGVVVPDADVDIATGVLINPGRCVGGRQLASIQCYIVGKFCRIIILRVYD